MSTLPPSAPTAPLISPQLHLKFTTSLQLVIIYTHIIYTYRHTHIHNTTYYARPFLVDPTHMFKAGHAERIFPPLCTHLSSVPLHLGWPLRYFPHPCWHIDRFVIMQGLFRLIHLILLRFDTRNIPVMSDSHYLLRSSSGLPLLVTVCSILIWILYIFLLLCL